MYFAVSAVPLMRRGIFAVGVASVERALLPIWFVLRLKPFEGHQRFEAFAVTSACQKYRLLFFLTDVVDYVLHFLLLAHLIFGKSICCLELFGSLFLTASGLLTFSTNTSSFRPLLYFQMR